MSSSGNVAGEQPRSPMNTRFSLNVTLSPDCPTRSGQPMKSSGSGSRKSCGRLLRSSGAALRSGQQPMSAPPPSPYGNSGFQPQNLLTVLSVTEIVTRKRAIELGLTKYFTGKPCPHGHNVERYIDSYTCVTCQASRCSKVQRKNRDKLNRAKRLRRAANPAKYRERDKIYDAVRRGNRISKPERGTGALQVNLQPDQCQCIIRQPVPPTACWKDRSDELEAFKLELPGSTICCGAETVPGSRWCKYHDAVRRRLEQADTSNRLISAPQW
jgi:hypothetical protein